jgi:hypothetical protein
MGKITGNTGAFQQPYEVHKNESGVRTTVPYESTDPNQILAWQLSASLAGLPYDVKFSYGKGHIDVHYPYDFTKNPTTEVVNLWELFAQKVEKDILEADLSFGQLNAISPLDAFLIKTALAEHEAGTQIKSDWFTVANPPTKPFGPTRIITEATLNDDGTVATAAKLGPVIDGAGNVITKADDPANCYSAFCLMAHGVRSYPILAPCLRHTQTVNAQYSIKASLTNVGYVLSTARLQSDEAIPSVLFNLPVFNDPPHYIEVAGDLKYGWYKDFPTVRQIAGMKWNIEQEWQYGLYSVKLYGEPLT